MSIGHAWEGEGRREGYPNSVRETSARKGKDMMIKLLRLLSKVYKDELRYKTRDYKDGFAACIALLNIHLLKQGTINETVILRRRLIHEQRQRASIKRSTSLQNIGLRNRVWELERKVKAQKRNITILLEKNTCITI